MFLCKIVCRSFTSKVTSNDVNYLLCSFSRFTSISSRRCQSSFTNLITDDVSKVFFEKDAQILMKRLTEFDLNKIFRTRTVGYKSATSRYAFMTNEELNEAQKKAVKKGYRKLQMPPIVPVHSNEVEILDNAPEIVGYSSVKHVFTDISYGISDKNRLIVVREPSGILRKAFSSERHRMNEIYFSRPGRKLQHPKMFELENLQNLWQRGEFEFILDRACCQFEPDDPEFHDVTFKTYEKVNEVKAFQNLRSTRHFGTLVFYLCVTKNLDNLIEENLNTERLNEAVLAIRLYRMVNVDCEFNKLEVDRKNKINYVKEFLESESSKKDMLIDLLNSYVVEVIPIQSSN